MRHPNIDLAERAWLAVAESDLEVLEALWAPGIVWHVTAENPWTGDHVGREAVLDYLAAVGEAGEAYEASLEDILASDDRVLILSRVTARRGSRAVDTHQGLLARIEDGRMVEVWTMPLEPAAFARFWKRGSETRSGASARRVDSSA